jgi:hypothetical protein
MLRRSTYLIAGFTCVLVTMTAIDAAAMPNFARKLNVPCATCHTTIPRLNETGFKFRAAGWRLPEDIGKPETKPFNLADYFAGRIQARYDASRTRIAPLSSHRSQLRFHELTFYPVTGSFEKYFSSLVELSFLPGEPAAVENGYVRANKGDTTTFFQGRFGIFHPFEGFGASDRPIAISRPYFQTNAANSNQSTLFTPWGFDQAGIEGGLDYKRTSVRGTVFNGLELRQQDGVLTPFAAQGGALSKSSGLPSSNTVDFQLFANQILQPDGGAVSAFYYHGNLDLPVSGTSNFFQNTFDRVALYAGYPIVQQLQLYGGVQQGRDHLLTGNRFRSRGAFAEADVPFHEYATVGARYDWFDPARNKADDEIRGVFGYVNVPLQNGLQFIAEYQNKNTKRGVNPERKDNIFQLRFIFIQ